MIAIERILVAHDFSETSAEAVTYGVALAKQFGAALHVLHVGEQVRFEMDMEFPLGLDDMNAATRERMLTIVSAADQASLAPEFVVRTGQPAAAIVSYASEAGIDLIVMGTHGRGFVGHVVMGSVAESVVRTAPCPVLTVRHAAQPLASVVDVQAHAGATA
jgi:nucleotide-binding universal stress UspA family protein